MLVNVAGFFGGAIAEREKMFGLGGRLKAPIYATQSPERGTAVTCFPHGAPLVWNYSPPIEICDIGIFYLRGSESEARSRLEIVTLICVLAPAIAKNIQLLL